MENIHIHGSDCLCTTKVTTTVNTAKTQREQEEEWRGGQLHISPYIHIYAIKYLYVSYRIASYI